MELGINHGIDGIMETERQAVAMLNASTVGNKMNVKTAYEVFRGRNSRKKWSKVVWDSVNLPPQSVIAALARQISFGTLDNVKA